MRGKINEVLQICCLSDCRLALDVFVCVCVYVSVCVCVSLCV